MRQAKNVGAKSQVAPISQVVLISAVLLAIAAGSLMFLQHDHTQQASVQDSQTLPSPHLDSEKFWKQLKAHRASDEVKKKLAIRVANALEEYGWTESEAAENLEIAPEKLSSLLHGNPDSLEIEQAMKMLLAMDMTIDPNEVISPVTNEDRNDAVQYYTRVLNADPKNSTAYLQRANEYERLEQNDLAIADRMQANLIKPNTAVAQRIDSSNKDM